jgi:hypothetical protein
MFGQAMRRWCRKGASKAQLCMLHGAADGYFCRGAAARRLASAGARNRFAARQECERARFPDYYLIL